MNSVRFTLNLRPEERKVLEEIARQQGRPLSVALRRILREAARTRGLLPELVAFTAPSETKKAA
jgi:hypothetical protein